MKKRTLAMFLTGAMCFGLLAGCGGDTTPTPTPDAGGAETPDAPYEIAVNFASEPQTIDPALNSAVDGAIMCNHMFEGLMKWVDAGTAANGTDGTVNNAKIDFGQAESYDKVVNEDGTVTYTFKLRDDAKWSDGKPVTAGDFVYSWQRLVDPATAADYNYMIDTVVNANEIMAGEKDKTELAVSAPDDKTFVVTLHTDAAYFIEVCAFPATFPVRQDMIEQAGDQWTFSTDTYISNGAYKLTQWEHNAAIVMEPNEYYYDVENLGPDKITFKLMDDANAMLSAYKDRKSVV